MAIELQPETERLVQEEIQRGHFHSVDELIVKSVHAWREKQHLEHTKDAPRKSLYQLLSQPPFAGSGLEIDRVRDYPRDIELS